MHIIVDLLECSRTWVFLRRMASIDTVSCFEMIELSRVRVVVLYGAQGARFQTSYIYGVRFCINGRLPSPRLCLVSASKLLKHVGVVFRI